MQSARGGPNVVAAYGAVAGISADPEAFMKMALDAARTFLRQAETAIADGNKARKAKALASASKVIEFLLGAAGIEHGPLSECLTSVYQYVLGAILKANLWDDAEAVTAGRVALDDLAMVWRRVFPDRVRNDKMPPVAALMASNDDA